MDSERDAATPRRQLTDPSLVTTRPVYRPLSWTLLGCMLLFIGWAAWAQLNEVTYGDDRVVPFSRIRKIRSLKGDIPDRLLVKEGNLVEVSQSLVRLNETRFLTNFQESANQASVLCAAITQLDAKVLGRKSTGLPPDVDPEGPLARSERGLFKSHRDKLVKDIQTVQRQIHLAQSQLDLVRPLVAKRAVSQMEALKLSQDTITLSGELIELKSAYFQDAYTERAQRKTDLGALKPIVQQRQDRLRRTEILSPIHGRANTVLVNTCGGAIQPGEPIMEVIPVEERLLVEAKVKPRGVAFLVPGVPAKVETTAYDYTIYGDLKGALEQISTDTIEGGTLYGEKSYYQVLIRADGSQLKHGGEVLPTIPRMVAEADILSGKYSVLNYLLWPLIKACLY